MAVVSPEVSSIVIASTATHRSLLGLHCKPPPSVAGTVPRSPRCESQVDKDEHLVRILPENAPLDGPSELETRDLRYPSGSTPDHFQQAIAIDLVCSISEETVVASEPSPPTINDRHVQVENCFGLPVLKDAVYCTTAITHCSCGLCKRTP